MALLKISLCCLFYFTFIYCLYLVPERAEIDFYNSEYLSTATINVRRYSRHGGYVVNIFGKTLNTWGNNITFHVYLFEFLHNEYKSTFIEFHFKFCELLSSDPYIGKSVVNTGAIKKCPMPPGSYALANMTLGIDDFPYLWPFERARAEGILMHGKTIVANGSIYLQFKQKKIKN